MSLVKVKCYCGKWLDDPTHKETHQDKFLTEKEFYSLDLTRVSQSKFRSKETDPWKYLLSKRVGNVFYMIGIFQPNT